MERRSRLLHGLMALFLLGFFSLPASCDDEEIPDPPTDGFLVVQVVTTDLNGTKLEGLEKLQVKGIAREVVHRSDCNDPATEHVLTITDEPFLGDMVTSVPNIPQILSPQMPVPPGCVLQVRLIVQEMSAFIDGQEFPVKVPSGLQTGIKVIPADGTDPFPIFTGLTTVIRATYDPNKKLVMNKGVGIIEKPVLQAVVVPPESALGIILDEIVVTFDPSLDDTEIGDIVASVGGTMLRHWPHAFVTVKLPSTDQTVEMIAAYEDQDGVLVALPNTLLDLQGPNPLPPGTLPNDPHYADAPPAGFESLNFDSINALDAWYVTTGDRQVVAAVVDNGFDVMHSELMNNIWLNPGELPAGIIDADGDGVITFIDLNDSANDGICPKGNSAPTTLCDPLDIVNGNCQDFGAGFQCQPGYGFQDGLDGSDANGIPDDIIGWDFHFNDNLPEPFPLGPPPNGSGAPFHGTAVAGMLGGIGNNGIAQPGTAWNVRIMLLKGQIISEPLGAEGAGLPPSDRLLRDSMIRGVAYAHQMGAKIVNLSLGSAIFREDAELAGCDRGIHFVPADKFNLGITRLNDEWAQQVGIHQDSAVTVVALNDCAAEDDDAPGHFFYPGGFVVARPDIGTTFVHQTMITVVSVETWDSFNNQPWIAPPLSGFSSFGAQTALIGAPGEFWRILDSQTYPPAGLSSGFRTSCGGGLCKGTSLAAPIVAGAGALVLANNPGLAAIDIKGRLLDNARDNPALDNRVSASRMLDIAASVGS